jgi:hypothetical protein
MNRLFVYGTLQEKTIQLELTNRFQEGEVDSISGFKVLRDYLNRKTDWYTEKY